MFVTAADTGTVDTTVGSQTASVTFVVCNGQSAAVVGFIVLQTGIAGAARQCIVTVQLNVRVAFAGNAYSGTA